MKASGIVRKIDDLGRIVLPIEMRNRLDLSAGDGVEIFFEDDCVVLKKFHESCLFCGSQDDVIEFHGKRVCTSCIAEMEKAAR